MPRHIVTINEISEHCNVSHNAILKWIKDGNLYAYRQDGDRKSIRVVDYIDFLDKYCFPIPKDFEDMVRHKKRILIVDDDKTIVRTIQKVLEKQCKYIIEIAYDGVMAQNKIKTFKPDLITLDVHMPKLNGYEVCLQVRGTASLKNTQIMFISAYSDYDDSKFAFDMGADEFINKPFQNKDLVRRVDALLKVGQK